MIKRECGSCESYNATYSTSSKITGCYEYGKCVKGKKEEVKKTDCCPFYQFSKEAAEDYKPNFFYEETIIQQLFTIDKETMEKHLSSIQNPFTFRMNNKGDIHYKYDLRLLLQKLRGKYSPIQLQRAEWFILQKTQQYEKEVEQLSKTPKEFNILK
ncbi:hypothetical protein [Virgibacillus halodenitrificans]|uniref:hypothetical protein n=1 Tax=Virgibacillus halodenitrificans TaxID=1482 RepID=UPI000EF4C1DD|nr:hypothetical protein [Virgibacillus halodenitrificans]